MPEERQNGGNPITVDLGPSEAIVNELATDVEKWLAETLERVIPKISLSVSDHLMADAPRMLKSRRRARRSFESQLGRFWEDGLRLLEMMIVIATEAGDDFNSEFRPEAAKQRDFVFEVLTRLHARACQVASEVLTLIKSGYPDGAHARWRSLHEIAVVSILRG